MDRDPWPQRSFGPRAASFAALVLMLAAFATGLAVFLYQSPVPSEPRTAANRLQEGPVTVAAPPAVPAPPTPAPTPVAETIKESVVAPAAPEAPPPRVIDTASEPNRNPLPSKPIVAQPSASAQTDTAQAPMAAKPMANIPERQPGGTAKLILAVSPQGELYIDDKHFGTTPPITTLDLEAGMHRIEIRSGSWKPYLTYITVQAGDLRRIRHDFGAKPSGPPR